MTLAVEAAGLRLRYGDVTALDDLSFTLPGGRIYGLLGRNGSGKTSLLSVLAGFRKASAGTALIDGQPVFENPRSTRRVCLIRETGDTGDKDEKVGEALYTASRLRVGWDGDHADALVERFQIPRGKKLGQLSLGQRSALGMIFGLAARAPVTLLDECHLGMDAPSRAAFSDELLADFMAHPRTIVISTHLIDELSPLFEEVLIIDQGRLVLQDETESLRARGADVTGPAEAVDRFVAGRTVLRERQLAGPSRPWSTAGWTSGTAARPATPASTSARSPSRTCSSTSPSRQEDHDERPRRRPLGHRPPPAQHPPALPGALLGRVRRRRGGAHLRPGAAGRPRPERLGPSGVGGALVRPRVRRVLRQPAAAGVRGPRADPARVRRQPGRAPGGRLGHGGRAPGPRAGARGAGLPGHGLAPPGGRRAAVRRRRPLPADVRQLLGPAADLGHHRAAAGRRLLPVQRGELVAIALALAMVVATGTAIGFDGLPLLGSVVDLARVPLAGTLALCLAGLLPGMAVTWAMVRDIPIRNRVT